MSMDKILKDIKWEAEQAVKIWQPFNSLHEAYAIVLEEMNELWEEVKRSQKDPGRIPYAREEAIQVAAMAVRLILDCCSKECPVCHDSGKLDDAGSIVGCYKCGKDWRIK